MTTEQYFLSEAISHALSLPHQDCLRFLRGMLETCHSEDSLHEVRTAYLQMQQAESQLELLVSPQESRA